MVIPFHRPQECNATSSLHLASSIQKATSRRRSSGASSTAGNDYHDNHADAAVASV